MKVQPLMKVGLVSLLFFSAMVGLNPSHAQTQEELLSLIQQQAALIEGLQKRLDVLENQSQQNAATVHAVAQQAENAEQKAAKAEEKVATAGDSKFKWGPSPTVKSADGNFSAHVRGRLLIDYGKVKDASEVGSQNRSATEFRAARLGLEGTAWQDVKYKFEVDFANNEVEIKDAYAEYAGLSNFKIRVGQFKEAVSLEEEGSTRHISLMERGNFTDAFGFARRLGVKVLTGGDIWTASAAVFGGSISENADDEGYALTGRVAVFPKIGNGGQLHFGASVRHRGFGNDYDEMEKRYRQRPQAHVSGVRYVDTGTLEGLNSDTNFGVEAAGIFGPFWVESEWAWLSANVADDYVSDYNGQNSAKFQGGFIGAGWFITGESRGYKKGKFDRPKVNNPVMDGGMGAWSVVARYDYLDLVDEGADIFGGKQKTWILGVNWYLNRHTVVKVNYAHANISESFAGAYEKAYVDEDGKNSVNSFTARVQVDW